MLRVVVPTVYCRDPLDEMLGAGSAWYFQQPRALGCRRMNSLMTWPMLAAFADVSETLESSSSPQDNDDNACSCQKKCCKPDGGSTDSKLKDQDCVVNSDESTKPPSNEQVSDSNQTSEKGKTSEAVSVPMKRLDPDLDTGRFQVSLDLKEFQPEEIEVNRVDNELKIYAKHRVQRHGMIFHREVQRSYQLPDDVDTETLKSTLTSDGVLSVEAQRKPQDSDSSDHLKKDEQESLTDVKEGPAEETFSESTMNDEGEKTTESHQDISTNNEDTEEAKETTEEVDESNHNEAESDHVQEE